MELTIAFKWPNMRLAICGQTMRLNGVQHKDLQCNYKIKRKQQD